MEDINTDLLLRSLIQQRKIYFIKNTSLSLYKPLFNFKRDLFYCYIFTRLSLFKQSIRLTQINSMNRDVGFLAKGVVPRSGYKFFIFLLQSVGSFQELLFLMLYDFN